MFLFLSWWENRSPAIDVYKVLMMKIYLAPALMDLVWLAEKNKKESLKIYYPNQFL